MNEWTQPICRACYAAWLLGRGESPHREPTRALGGHNDACLVCGEPSDGIYVRVDPKLTEEVDSLRAQLKGAVEDARDAGEASMQAAFWRARAIELGASEDEYRKAYPIGGQ